MLSQLEAHATVPCADLARARKFYEGTLGFVAKEAPAGVMYGCKNSWFLLFPTPNAGTAKNTAMGWATPNIEKEVAELRGRGVVFEEYDFPGLKTVNGIATTGPNRTAWFKDTEGNILGIVQLG